MFVIDLVANLRELYVRTYEVCYVRTDLYMKLHTELGRLCYNLVANYDIIITKFSNNCVFSNNTPEHFNLKTNKFHYAILL